MAGLVGSSKSKVRRLERLKVYLISDLHWDHGRKNWELFLHLVNFCCDSPPDILIFAGDLAETEEGWHKGLQLLGSLPFYKLLVPGNHDLWVRHSTATSLLKYRQILPQIAREHQWHYLPGNPITINQITFYGSSFWYDYSLLPSGHPFSLAELQLKQRGKMRWMDGVFCNFEGMSDQAITQMMLQDLEADLLNHKTEGPRFLVTHFPCYPEMMRFTQTNWEREYFGAFMGSNALLPLIDKFQYHACGHLHREERFRHNRTEVFLSPVGYFKEWVSEDPLIHLKNRLLEIRL